MSAKYQREIEEILNKIEEPLLHRAQGKKQSYTRAALGGIGQFLGGRSWNLSPGRIMVSSVLLLLVALLFKASMPGFLGPAIAWGAIVLFILGYALFFIKPGSPYEKRWRGQPIETSPRWWERLLRKFKDD